MFSIIFSAVTERLFRYCKHQTRNQTTRKQLVPFVVFIIALNHTRALTLNYHIRSSSELTGMGGFAITELSDEASLI